MGQQCQKQPSRKTAIFSRRNTTSARQRRPGSGAASLRNLRPRRWRADLSASSGRVSRSRLPRIRPETPAELGGGEGGSGGSKASTVNVGRTERLFPGSAHGTAAPSTVPAMAATVPLSPGVMDSDYGASMYLSQSPALTDPWAGSTFDDLVDTIRDEAAIEEDVLKTALILLSNWHTMIVGPPGTGKTLLAEILAEYWNVELRVVTPSMDWTAFHAIGGKAPGPSGLDPYDGVVTQAILDCCRTTISHAHSGSGKQGTWLLIDEINRCEADRVFTPLLTALGSRTQPQRLALAHHEDPLKRYLYLPKTFRLLTTANESDAQFVEPLSQAFLRRFQRVDLRRVTAPPLDATLPYLLGSGAPSDEHEPFVQEMWIAAAQVANQTGATTQVLEPALVLLARLRDALSVRVPLGRSGKCPQSTRIPTLIPSPSAPPKSSMRFFWRASSNSPRRAGTWMSAQISLQPG